jgi:Family of unknown function (DUF6519)
MGSDRARISYDAKQQYRAVVAQQGRVTLEADWNESQQLIDETIQEETLDMVGASGTPNDGYHLLSIPKEPFDFTIQAGTIYVGGMRAVLQNDISYSNQSDWLDRIDDRDWVTLEAAKQATQSELVYLLLREQEVSAVEDSALREVALGGPDTAQRSRLIQHIVRLKTEELSCSKAWDKAIEQWKQQGLELDPKDPQHLRLKSATTLQVSFPAQIPLPDPCEPAARGGYLGADNQLIRVQITIDANGQHQLVWGYDNASFLYRVNVVTDRLLKLQSRPVDEFHHPRTGQVVEVLRPAARLSNGEYIAAATGKLFTLGADYNPDRQEVTLPSAFNNPDITKPEYLFLRVWEKNQPFTLGQPVLLAGTGMAVTIQSSSKLHHGDYWLIAVRPSTPIQVYPQHLIQPQPPNGPHLWVCPLSVIAWKDGQLEPLDDCRHPFDNLVKLTQRNLGGCCTVTVRPEDLGATQSLQNIIDQFKNKGAVTICLMPGEYKLSAPLVLGPEHSNLTLAGCHDGVVLKADPDPKKIINFLQGLVVLNRANNVTLRQLRFDLPQVPFILAKGKLAGLKASQISRLVDDRLQNLRVSIGVRPIHCAVLKIEDCLFRYSLTKDVDVFGVGIFAGSECWGLTVKNCRFLHEEDYLHNLQAPLRMLIGYVLVPTAILKRAASLVPSLLQNAVFKDNQFSGLTLATTIMADLGTIDIENNKVQDCYSGFWLITLRSLLIGGNEQQQLIDRNISNPGDAMPIFLLQLLREPVTYLAFQLAQSYPLPKGFNPSTTEQISVSAIPKAQDTGLLSSLTTASPAANSAPAGAPSLARINVANLANKDTLGFFMTLGNRIEALKLVAFQQSQRSLLQLSLDFSHNRIETLIPNAPSGINLFVWDTNQRNQSMMTMTANHLRNRDPGLNVAKNNPQTMSSATAMVLQVDRCTITGNLILNESVFSGESQTSVFYSLILRQPASQPEIAVTGNVFKGKPCLPLRSSGNLTLNNWNLFNTLIS